MKTVETLSIFVCIFLITWSAGDGAPQWRPQGRFGKRFSNSRTNDFMTALESGSLSNTDDSLESFFLNDPDLDIVNNNNNNNNALDDFFTSNSQSGLSSSGLSASSSMTSSRWPYQNSRICIETSLPGVFRCHRRGKAGTSVVTLQE